MRNFLTFLIFFFLFSCTKNKSTIQKTEKLNENFKDVSFINSGSKYKFTFVDIPNTDYTNINFFIIYPIYFYKDFTMEYIDRFAYLFEKIDIRYFNEETAIVEKVINKYNGLEYNLTFKTLDTDKALIYLQKKLDGYISFIKYNPALIESIMKSYNEGYEKYKQNFNFFNHTNSIFKYYETQINFVNTQETMLYTDFFNAIFSLPKFEINILGSFEQSKIINGVNKVFNNFNYLPSSQNYAKSNVLHPFNKTILLPLAQKSNKIEITIERELKKLEFNSHITNYFLKDYFENSNFKHSLINFLKQNDINVYDFNVNIINKFGGTFMQINISTDHDKFFKTVKVIFINTTELIQTGFTIDEFEILKKRFLIFNEDNLNKIYELNTMISFLKNYNIKDLKNLNNNILKLKLEDINKLLKEILPTYSDHIIFVSGNSQELNFQIKSSELSNFQ